MMMIEKVVTKTLRDAAAADNDNDDNNNKDGIIY